jgi:hypothetical protein
MNTKKNFENLYDDVSQSIAKATISITLLNIENEEGKAKLGNMVKQLVKIKSRFDSELNLLNDNAEWDRFTMVFFGETNAGKSTIIDSLRILFNEDSRLQLLQGNQHNLLPFEQELNHHLKETQNSFAQAFTDYTADIAKINEGFVHINQCIKEQENKRTSIIANESAERIHIAELETAERLQNQQLQAKENNRIIQEESSTRIKKKMMISGVVGIFLGGLTLIITTFLVGG